MADVTEVRVRFPGSAYLPIILLAVCVTPMVQHVWAALVYLVPLAALLYVVRAATIATADGLTVRAIFGSVHVPWDQILGFSADSRGRIYAARTDETVLRLPCVRLRHLAGLALVSGGRLDPNALRARPDAPATRPGR
jgi:hypothetical protein